MTDDSDAATEPREWPVAAPELPAGLTERLAGARWWRNGEGAAGCRVYRIAEAGGGACYLKHGRGRAAQDLVDEMVRMRWFAGRMPVPELLWFTIERDAAWLLMRALPGETLAERLDRDPAGAGPVIDAVAAFLRRLHALPVDDCPFDAGAAVRTAQARERLRLGLVDLDELDDARQGWSADDLARALDAERPATLARVVTHGDFSPENLMIDGAQVTGCIDLGRAGVADPYQDLAILGTRLEEIDPALAARLFAGYGIATPDAARAAFHLLLDECF